MREVATIRQVIAGMDPTVPVYDVKTLDEQIDQHLATDRMIAMSATFFGVLAALLAALGLYGVVSYAVATRTREIGIRMALGAQPRDLFRPVMVEVGITVLSGVGVGLPCAVALGRFVSSVLFNLEPGDPLVLLEASLLMISVALIAGYIPARRTAHLDPMNALRHE
jgi:ABC-type antimicrobial peptide transport system permease subunit